MMNIDFSRRAANALRPLLMSFDLRNHFVETIANSQTFDSLPLWSQNLIIYAEQFPNVKETSVPIPRRILPQGFESGFKKKILGTPIGGVAEFDGDVDGHVTGPDGEDNVPFVAPKILRHAGSQYLKSLDEQKSVLEKEFGDLSKTENATRAFKQTFKNLREFNMFDPKKTSLSALELAHTISLLHLGKDKRVADTVHYIGDARAVIGEKNWNGTNAASILGFSGEYGGTKIQHSIVFNKEVIGYPGGAAGWGDAIASQMKQQGASTEDIDKFWGMYVANHEWVHTEHHVSAMEHLGAPINSSAYDFITKLAESDGVDKKSFDLQFQQKLKELKLKQPDTDEEEIRDDLIFLMLSRNASKFMELVTSSKNDDLSRGELSQLGGRYPSTVSLYATENFAELVAEKSSASRMGHPAGNPNNPAWRKLEAFVRGGVTQEVATAGMTRQQRRQLERANQNKKELDKNNYFDGIDINDLTESDNTNNMVILSTCTGFPHSLKERQEKSLKVLGAPIGAKPSDELVDGDGDGYVASTPGGVDDTRVSPKQEKRPKGEITKGNIDLNNRPVVKNRDGSISTVRSITITEGNTAVVIPTVIKKPNGSGVIVGDREAIKYYQRSGQHLGKFSNIRDADTYAQNLHNQQAVQYPNPGKSFIGGGVLSFKGVPKPKRKPPTVTSADINSLAIRLRQHNAKSKPEQRTNLRDIKIVFLRGLEDGSHDEAKKRVIKFLSLMGSDKPKDTKYSEDNDLLPLDHPWRNRKTKKKQVEFSEPEYGVKYGDGCCPKLVKRYHSL